MMSIIRRQYGGDDIVCFGDLNLHPQDKLFTELKKDLAKNGVNILIPAANTRKGYGN